MILVNTEAVVSPKLKAEAYRAQASREDRREFTPFKNLSDEEITAYAEKAAKAVLAYDQDPTSLSKFEVFAQYGFSTLSKKTYIMPKPSRNNESMKKIFANGYQKFDYTKKLHLITCPVLWFAGKYDPLHPYKGAMRDVELIGNNCNLFIIDSGAPVYHDNPAAFNKLAREFLKKLIQ